MTDLPPAQSPLPRMPEAVTSFGAATLGDWLYVCGGHRGTRHAYSADSVSGAFHRLGLPDGRAWERLPAAEPAQGAPLVGHGRHVYRVGGMAARNRAGEPGDLHSKGRVDRFDTVRGEWEPWVPLPEPRSSHDATVVGDHLYVGGGWTLSGSFRGEWRETLLRLDLGRSGASWEEIPQPFRRRALALTGRGDEVWAIGGFDDEANPLAAVGVFDGRTGEWRRGPDLPPGPLLGFGCSAITHGGRVYVSCLAGQLLRLDAAGTAWETVGRLRHPRYFHQLVGGGGARLLAVGGEGGDAKHDDVEVLETEPVVRGAAGASA